METPEEVLQVRKETITGIKAVVQQGWLLPIRINSELPRPGQKEEKKLF